MTKPEGKRRLPKIWRPARGWRSPQPEEMTRAASWGCRVRCIEVSWEGMVLEGEESGHVT